ncbi:MAG TPA: tRNA uridine-5-carboxymethylaminomethyl(34) synthesis GTPase MnmE, partial [Spirochaetaceae bacterium]|nr:tRNA uridine-5-carboxymethylaminomethyl(34) synthesis GTPase MnmE [Spirochaetaceae bacterium]
MSYLNDDPIYALCTVYGVSAIAVYRVSGKGSIRLLNKILDRKIVVPENKCLAFRKLVCDGKHIDDALLSVFAKGHGYTKEECVEISIHGSVSIIGTLDRVFGRIGFRKALRGEFTYRALRNGALTVLQAESVLALINSRSENQQRQALESMAGALDEAFSQIREHLVSIASGFELQLDYSEDEYDEHISFPENEISELIGSIASLISGYEMSKKREEGVGIVIFGKTNEGKSSLFNFLLKDDRSIVSPIRGTTRDYVGEEATICGQKVMLYDTAGLNETDDAIESEGIRRSVRKAEEADLIIYFASDDEDNAQYDRIIRRLEADGKPVIRVRGKSDLRIKRAAAGSNGDEIFISCKTGDGIDALVAEISKRIKGILRLDEGGMLLTSARQENILRRILQTLKKIKSKPPIEICAILVSEALQDLSELVSGSSSSGEIA